MIRQYTADSLRDLDDFGNDEITFLAEHFQVPLDNAGFAATPLKLQREWKTFKRMTATTRSFSAMGHRDFYDHMRDTNSEKINASHFFNVLLIELLLNIIVVDTSECERVFFLMNFIMSAIRNRMGEVTLRDLMRIHTMKEKWLADPSSIPVQQLVERWYEVKERRVKMSP